MRTFLGQVPLSAIAAGLTVVIAVVMSRPLARRLGSGRAVAALLLLGFGLAISATLVPTAAALEGSASSGTCDTSRMGIASIGELTAVTFASLNVILFLPLGLAVGLLPRTRATLPVALAALSLTFVIEGLQLLIPVLGRGCQTADIFDNLLGLGLGLAAGVLARPLIARSRA